MVGLVLTVPDGSEGEESFVSYSPSVQLSLT